MSKQPSGVRTLSFVVVLCLVSALILALMATGLRSPQHQARQLDQAKQMLQAAHLFGPDGSFEMDGQPASYDVQRGVLVSVAQPVPATKEQIHAVFNARLKPYLANDLGEITTFEALHIDLDEYIAEHQVSGYAQLQEKLFYVILPNYSSVENPEGQGLLPAGYVIPVAGFGLWGPIFGYLALGADADTVIGTTWSAPQETPGLGAIIQESKWQEKFEGKQVFLPPLEGEVNLTTASLGLTVVKGRVTDVFGQSPRAQTAVDGISGATLTCNGVSAAYQRSLAPYRPLLVRAHDAYEQQVLLEGLAAASP